MPKSWIRDLFTRLVVLGLEGASGKRRDCSEHVGWIIGLWVHGYEAAFDYTMLNMTPLQLMFYIITL